MLDERIFNALLSLLLGIVGGAFGLWARKTKSSTDVNLLRSKLDAEFTEKLLKRDAQWQELFDARYREMETSVSRMLEENTQLKIGVARLQEENTRLRSSMNGALEKIKRLEARILGAGLTLDWEED